MKSTPPRSPKSGKHIVKGASPNLLESRIRPAKFGTERKRIKLASAEKTQFVVPETPCQVLDECRACSLLDLDYRKQLKLKSDALREQVKSQENPVWHSVPVPDCVASQQRYAYRHTAKLVVAQRLAPNKPGEVAKKWISIGLYKPGTHTVVDIGPCPVQAPHLNSIIGYLRKAIKAHSINVYNELGRTGDLRYVVLRHAANTRQTLVTFVTKEGKKAPYIEMAREMMEQFSTTLCGVLIHKNESAGNAIFQWEDKSLHAEVTSKSNTTQLQGDADLGNGETTIISGSRYLTEEFAGLRLRMSAESFMQVNPEVSQRMYHRIVELCDISKNDNVLDLYCGVGILSLLLAQNSRRVVGIEENTSSIDDARVNASENKIPNVDFLSGRAEDLLIQLAHLQLNSQYHVVTVNPSRRGCQKVVLQKIAELNPRRIIYMSCAAQTLLRDGSILADLGYRPRFLEPHDMFPGTPHLESLCLFEKI